MRRRFDIDFARRAAPVPPVAWALALIGVLATAACGLYLNRQIDAADRAREQTTALEADLKRAGVRTTPGGGAATSRATRAGEEDPGTLARRVVAELRRPWAALLDQLEATRIPGVELSQITVDARFERIQLQVEARSLDEVLRYVAQLPAGNGAGGPISRIRLVSHEARDRRADGGGGLTRVARLSGDLSTTASASSPDATGAGAAAAGPSNGRARP